MSAWAYLISKASEKDLPLFNAALKEIQDESARRLAEKQRAFFGSIAAQGNDGEWYNVSDWLMGKCAECGRKTGGGHKMDCSRGR